VVLRRRPAVLLGKAKRTHRQLHSRMLVLIAALLLSVTLGYAGQSGLGGVAFAAEEKNAAERAAPSKPPVEDLPAAAPAATSNTKVPKLGGPGGTPLKPFLTAVLDDLNKKWAQAFADNGNRYTYAGGWLFQDPAIRVPCPPYTLYNDYGPLYCPSNLTIYWPTNWVVGNTGTTLELWGEFPVAVVMAHEVGHHVQNHFDLLNPKYQQAGLLTSTQIELMADCLAGSWANTIYWEGGIGRQEFKDALRLLGELKDEYHGTAQQRQDWFLYGYKGGDCSAVVQ
jgi:predicted metalloprotease